MSVTTWELKGKTVLVTGATNGIGEVTAQALAAQGAHVVIMSRSAARCAETTQRIQKATGNPAVEWIAADLSTLAGINEAADEFLARHQVLHVLVNNAGGVFADRQVTADGYEMTFALNHLNYFLLTRRLWETLVASAPARIVNVSSDAHFSGKMNFDDLMGAQKYSSWAAYSQSKLANVMFTYELARRLDGSDVTANVLHPGFVATGFGRNNGGLWSMVMPLAHLFAKNPAKGAETSIYLASSPAVAQTSGKYFSDSKEKKSSDISYDVAAQQRLWEMSEAFVAAPQPAGA
ncbi:MAG: SDR family oxidoreductase [Caldilinea sp.]|nr:SDR family oxidoreductase [Caldilinea sp.]MCB0057750.1 SDR family oxidoreductase [Caldilineaceae bacterium]MCB0039411.1 SDR family oxidoreductase [Caldilinea sp.]MCB0068202.1 SDR family oxidoreductase [Caldilineaceae bacterium]MCB0151830.1 SDR family oxidoreductase [Caldilineaceae bacterium]